ncbi:serine hydrolase domain-containing protein [Kitasatospora sp. NPDC048540]|uniref:serine hydrolase domain-containing protein n=1 Tax=Kitasatospora sp. NPDC048540 TaxID=3155634 RepID=UPI0034007EFE
MSQQASQTDRPSGRQRRGRRRTVPVAAALAVGVLALGALVAPAASAAPGPDTLQRSLDALVHTDGVPAALASVTDRSGRTRTYTAGVGDVVTGSPVPADGQVRIGSNTKTFTAVVVLQLAAEHRLRLDAPVDRYLPGLLRGDGIDGRGITVRQLLQHTSGLPNYTDYLDDDIRPYQPRELVDLALRHKAEFAPGTSWAYSNTNYILAGMIIEKVTGRTVAEQIDRRIIQPLGLRHTSFPAPGDATIREAHPHGYYQESAGGPLHDITEMDPSWAWAAGQMISTNSDLNRFFTALLRGDLLPPAQLAQMRTTVPAESTFGPGARYGLGLASIPLSCGGVYWGHGGSIPGYETRGGVTETGRAANVAVTVQPTDEAGLKHLTAVVDRALCP